MDLVKLDRSGSSTDDMSIKQLDSSNACLSSGNPEILPRVGDKYQVEIPPVLGKSDYALYKRNPVCLQNAAGYPFNFLVGLCIPVTQKNVEVGPLNHDSATFLGDSKNSSNRSGNLGSQVSEGEYFCSKKENLETKFKPCDIASDDGATFDAPESENQKLCMTSCYHLVPGSDVDPWSDYERRSFVLGLYIFGKDFVQVKKFVENKRMGDILFSYYGRFYGSHEYQRWSACRKAQNRKCVLSEKIFTGRRQQELLSRLLLNVSKECQQSLLEISKKFRAGKMELEEYVFTLKAMVGIKILIEAVGIGKGKQDLTSVALDCSCTNQVVRVKVPAGKACADLEPNEIIKFLTGDYRLSKARASDLFWEAVWPRLLARGWQSEQPKGGGNDSLVFLVPGVAKFSRELEKGKQYFESVTDILRRVASEPALIELNSRDDTGHREREDVCVAETEELKDEISKRKRSCYNQPQTTCRKSSGMKFTVVDTSLPHGLAYELKELKDLLPEVTNMVTPSKLLENRDQSTSEVSSNESDTDDAMLADQSVTDDSSSCLHNAKLLAMQNNETDHVAPATKRLCLLAACSQPTISSSQFCSFKTGSPSSCSANHDYENVDLSSQASSQGKTSSTTTSQGCDMECVERTINVHDKEHFHQSGENMCMVDLNVPQVPPDSEGHVLATELGGRTAHTYQKPENLNMEKTINDVGNTEQQHEGHVLVTELDGRTTHTYQKPENLKMEKTINDVGNIEQQQQQHEVVQRRHGTRNRPPTAKSLEALANGLLTVTNRPRKNRPTGGL